MRVGIHMTMHLLSLFTPFAPFTESATRAASVKASLTPRFLFAEHSKSSVSILTVIAISALLSYTKISKGLDSPSHL